MMRELSLNFIDWDCEDVIMELSRYIEKGFHVGT